MAKTPQDQPKTRGGWTCAACAHPARAEIDGALAARQSPASVAKRHNVAVHTIYNHRDKHLGAALAKAAEASPAVVAWTMPLSLTEQLEQQRARANALGAKAEAESDVRTALLALREWRGLVETQERILQNARATEARLSESREWREVSRLILHTLEQYPDAHAAVVKAIGEAIARSS